MEDADLLARCLLDALHARIAADAIPPRIADHVRCEACKAPYQSEFSSHRGCRCPQNRR